MVCFSAIIFLILTYLIASIPFGLVISKVCKKEDIRLHGSKNIGATNVTRVLGKKLGFITLILDALKGAVMVILAREVFAQSHHLSEILSLTALIAVIGHVFPIYLKFKGGKGVATTIAVILAINPLLGLITIGAWLAVFLITKISAAASLSSLLVASLFAIFSNIAIEQVALYLALFVIVTIRHKENIIRIKNGQENKIK